MKIRFILQNALAGLVVGWLVTVGFNYIWQLVIPIEDRAGVGPFHLEALGVILLAVGLPAIAGGVIGGRVSKEGGVKNQLLLAAIFGALFVLPFACFIFWYIQW
jgi:predicted MFS family arabinose efflux permease